MSGVSVVISVRDCERYLAAAIESVLGGTVRPDELVVVDDGSTDGSAAVAAGFGAPVFCIGQRPDGLAAACNRGLAATAGELVGFVDADDLWTERKLELQVEALESDPAIDAVFGRVVEFASPELSAEQRARVMIREQPTPGRLRGSMLVRRSLLDAVGPFDEAIRVGDFIDWFTRAEDAGARVVSLDDVVLRRRVHLSNMGRVGPDPGPEYVRLVRGVMRRRRGAVR